MDLIDLTITFTVIYHIALFGCIFTIAYKFTKFIFKLHNIEFNAIEFILVILTFTFVGYFLLPYLLVVIFDFIMYIFYIIITTIIPETGFPTLFIPLRELLMEIPPLKKFEARGIFRLFTNIFEFLGMSRTLPEGLKKLFHDHYLFSKNNIYELIKLFNPNINIDKFTNIIENMNNNNKSHELNNINNDIDVCIGSSSKITTPDMNYLDITKNNIDDMKNKFKCNLNAVPAYIATQI
jgi:hypothetical protein